MRIEKIKTTLMCSIIALLVIALGIGSITGYIAYDSYKNPTRALENPLQPVSTDSFLPVETDADSSDPVVTLPPSNFNNMFSVLFMGYDRGPGRPVNDGVHTDVMILCSVNLKTNEINLLTIPRDTKVTVKKLDGKGKATSILTARANTAFLYGIYGGAGINVGASNAVDMAERLLQVPIQNYILIDMDSVIALTQAIGGVPLTATVTIADAGIYEGQQYNLQGDQALRYVRDRHLPGTDNSDIERTARERQFVIAAAQKMKDSGPTKVLDSLYQMTKYYTTNMTYQQLLALASMLKNTDVSAIKTSMIDGEGDGTGAWIYDAKKLTAWRDSVYTQNN